MKESSTRPARSSGDPTTYFAAERTLLAWVRTGLAMMGDELPQPLSGEFRKCYDQHSLGQPLEDCMREMARRIFSCAIAATTASRM